MNPSKADTAIHPVRALTPEERELIQAGRLVCREKLRWDLSLRHRAVIDALVSESLLQGRQDVIMPHQRALHLLSGVPLQHLAQTVEDLALYRIVKERHLDDGGRKYAVNPDTRTWLGRPLAAPEIVAEMRALVASVNRRDADTLHASFEAQTTIPLFSALHESVTAPCEASGHTGEFPTSFITRTHPAS
jgi:hypothetical protein